MGGLAQVGKQLRAWFLGFIPWAERPGVRAFGQVDDDSPVLLTGNSGLTLLAVAPELRAIGGYLIVVDTKGRDLLSAVAAGWLTERDVIVGIAGSGLEEKVDHRRVMLNGALRGIVDPTTVEDSTGWEVLWGSVEIDLFGLSLIESERVPRKLFFPLKERLRIALSLALPFAPLTALPGLVVSPVTAAWLFGFSSVSLLLVGIAFPLLAGELRALKVTIFALLLGLVAFAIRLLLFSGGMIPNAAWAGALFLIGGWMGLLFPPRELPSNE